MAEIKSSTFFKVIIRELESIIIDDPNPKNCFQYKMNISGDINNLHVGDYVRVSFNLIAKVKCKANFIFSITSTDKRVNYDFEVNTLISPNEEVFLFELTKVRFDEDILKINITYPDKKIMY